MFLCHYLMSCRKEILTSTFLGSRFMIVYLFTWVCFSCAYKYHCNKCYRYSALVGCAGSRLFTYFFTRVHAHTDQYVTLQQLGTFYYATVYDVYLLGVFGIQILTLFGLYFQGYNILLKPSTKSNKFLTHNYFTTLVSDCPWIGTQGAFVTKIRVIKSLVQLKSLV